MAKIITRVWTSRGTTGRRVKHVSYGYQLMVNGKRERTVSATWQSEAEALDALTQRLKAIDTGRITRPADTTLGALVEHYPQYKADKGKRSLKEDTRILRRQIVPAFTSELPVRRLTETLIAQYEKRRAGQVSAFTVANELTVLGTMLRLGRKWGISTRCPTSSAPGNPNPDSATWTNPRSGGCSRLA